jgi:hypothetical protein
LYFFSIILFSSSFFCCNQNYDSGSRNESMIRITPGDLKVGEETIIRITINSPKEGIAADGGLFFPFYLKPWNGLIRGVTEDRQSNSLVTATRSDGGKVEVVNVLNNPQWTITSDLKVFIRETALKEGETLTIQFGTDDQQVVVGRKQLSFFLEVKIDNNGDGEYLDLDPPLFPVIESKPVKLCLVAPSNAKVGEEIEIIVYGEDTHQNVCELYTGKLDIFSLNESSGKHTSYQMHAWDHDKDLDRNSFSYVLDQEGIFYLKAIDHERNLSAISNPIHVSDRMPDKNLYWGEVHVHSQLSDGRGELQDVYRDGYARGLDFIAITDHGFGRSKRGTFEERIEEICREADRFNLPGEFVTIPAGETHYLPVMHMNMYFDEAVPAKILSLVNSIDSITKDFRKEWESMSSDLLSEAVVPYWDIFKREVNDKHTLVFPHHTMWLGIKPFLDPERTRVMEVYSIHGTSEIRKQSNTPKSLQLKPDRIQGDQSRKFSAREILNAGIRLGFTGGSDSHEGQAGYDAITGVYSDGLSRSSIISGIYDKECYVTSSNRTLIDIIPSENKYDCYVAGDGEIDQVEVIYNGEPDFALREIDGRICKFEWTPPKMPDGYFYIKVLMEDGKEAAWSSPVWL